MRRRGGSLPPVGLTPSLRQATPPSPITDDSLSVTFLGEATGRVDFQRFFLYGLNMPPHTTWGPIGIWPEPRHWVMPATGLGPSSHLIQELLRGSQVSGSEPLGESAVDRS